MCSAGYVLDRSVTLSSWTPWHMLSCFWLLMCISALPCTPAQSHKGSFTAALHVSK